MASKYTIRGVADMTQHDEQLKKSAAEVYKYQQTVNSTKGQMNQFSQAAKNVASSVSSVNDGIAVMNNTTAPLKLKLRELTNVLAEMEMKGQHNTVQFTQLAQYAGQLENAIGDARTAIRTYSGDTLNLQAATQAISGLAAAGQVATGVMGLLGTKNENVAKTLLMVQSATAIANGVQQIANVLNKDSALMLKLKATWANIAAATTAKDTVITGANTAGIVANTVATGANTVATKAWNVVKAISKALLGDFTGLLIVGAGALATYAIATKGSKEEEEKHRQALEESAKAAQDKADKINTSVGTVVAKYQLLKSEWKVLSNEHEKREWIKNNQSAFDSLGLSVKTLSDAEDAFVKDTSRVVNALIKRAEATAMAKVYEEDYIKMYKKKQTIAGGGYQVTYKQGGAGTSHKAMEFDNIKDETWKAAGIGRQDVTEAREGISFIYSLNKQGIDKINKYEREQALKRQKETEASIEKTKKDMIKAQKEAAEAEKGLSVIKPKTKTPTNKTPKSSTKSSSNSRTVKTVKDDTIDIDKVFKATKFEGKNNEIEIKPVAKLGIEAVDLKSEEFNKTLKEMQEIGQKKLDERKIYLNIDPEVATNFGNVTSEISSAFSSISDSMKNLDFDMPVLDVAGIIGQSIANVALGYSKATAEASSLGPWAWIAFAATGLAQMISMISSIKSATAGYATGGIVGGNTTIGDYNLIRANKGEMILNNREQARLFNMLSGSTPIVQTQNGGDVHFRISGNDLVGVLNNHNKKQSRVI